MRARLQKRLGSAAPEAGLTIIEVLVAAVVLVLGAAATFGVLGAATKNAHRAKATQVALDLAQEELERLHGIPYRNLALNTQPQSSSGELNPGSRVNGLEFNLNRNGSAEYAPLVIDTANGFSSESAFTIGDEDRGGIKGTVYRYVVWRDDPTCSSEQCPGSEDFKQIVVAVKPDRPVYQSGERGYVEVQSNLTDPETAEGEEGGGGGGGGEGEPEPEGGVAAQQFYLSDTPCAESGTTERVEPSEDHFLHNTLGTCASGLKTGNAEPGAPDALLLEAPPDPAPGDESQPLLYDYSDDFYLEPTPDTDRGVQIQRDDTPECHYDPTGTTNPESQVHRWVSDPVTSPFEMSGTVTLEFYTRTLNDAIYKAALCVYLFDRSEAGTPPVATDTFLTNQSTGNPYWLYVPQGNAYWPRNIWTRVRIRMQFASAPQFIAAGNRLGVGLSVERAGTPGGGTPGGDSIPVMYDHPNYPTRLEVDTSTPLEEEGE